jgi:hypothetical protein
MFPAIRRFLWPAVGCSQQFADFSGRLSDVPSNSPISLAGWRMFPAISPISLVGCRMFPAIRRFLWPAGGCSQQSADFSGRSSDVPSNSPISLAGSRLSLQADGFLWQAAGFLCKLADFSASCQLSLQADGFHGTVLHPLTSVT